MFALINLMLFRANIFPIRKAAIPDMKTNITSNVKVAASGHALDSGCPNKGVNTIKSSKYMIMVPASNPAAIPNHMLPLQNKMLPNVIFSLA